MKKELVKNMMKNLEKIEIVLKLQRKCLKLEKAKTVKKVKKRLKEKFYSV